mmetsp:Transcript_38840/g.110807  ORF Transcript_38840/g.110807 Transcript_38840/m.110807 type:complete len:266 (+) Transcript_38840:903-1700(+)
MVLATSFLISLLTSVMKSARNCRSSWLTAAVVCFSSWFTVSVVILAEVTICDWMLFRTSMISSFWMPALWVACLWLVCDNGGGWRWWWWWWWGGGGPASAGNGAGGVGGEGWYSGTGAGAFLAGGCGVLALSVSPSSSVLFVAWGLWWRCWGLCCEAGIVWPMPGPLRSPAGGVAGAGARLSGGGVAGATGPLFSCGKEQSAWSRGCSGKLPGVAGCVVTCISSSAVSCGSGLSRSGPPAPRGCCRKSRFGGSSGVERAPFESEP